MPCKYPNLGGGTRATLRPPIRRSVSPHAPTRRARSPKSDVRLATLPATTSGPYLNLQYEGLFDNNRRRLGKMLRVLMLVTGFPTDADAATGIFNARAAAALSRSAAVTVLHLRSWRPSRPIMENSTIDGVSVWRVAIPQVPVLKKTSLRMYMSSAWPLVRHLLYSCDIVHSVGLSFAGLLGARWARRAGVHHVTQITSEFELSSGQLRPTSADLGGIHGVACNSDALTALVHRTYRAARNVRTIYRGVDLQRFHPDGMPQQRLGRRSGVRFLYLGGFPSYRTKGGETLLAAWQTAQDELANASADLVIGGPGSMDPQIQRWRSSLRVPERVHLAGMVDPSEIASYLLASDAVLVPSLVEGFPNIAVEAAGCGRAVLASALDCIGELVVDGENGALLPAGDATAWAQALVHFAQRRDELTAFGRRARFRAEKFFDANAFAGNMMDLYHASLREPLERQALQWIAQL